MERRSRIQTMPFKLTTNASGAASTTKKLESDRIIGKITSFSDGNYESIEFYDLYVYTRNLDSQDVAEGGGEGSAGGSGGGSGITRLSPPSLTGVLFKRGQELVVSIKNAVAATVYHVLIPFQVVED